MFKIELAPKAIKSISSPLPFFSLVSTMNVSSGEVRRESPRLPDSVIFILKAEWVTFKHEYFAHA